MTPVSQSQTEVRFTPEFKRNLHALARKYRNIRSDIEPVIDQLQSGQRPGDQVPGVGYAIFKVRVRNTDAAKGKRGGYRLIYYVALPTAIILVTVYSKTEQSDITAAQIRRILSEFDNTTPLAPHKNAL
jgi:mRNA-degrading endonuclease RelE of RelBE toxin-antitoxin system